MWASGISVDGASWSACESWAEGSDFIHSDSMTSRGSDPLQVFQWLPSNLVTMPPHSKCKINWEEQHGRFKNKLFSRTQVSFTVEWAAERRNSRRYKMQPLVSGSDCSSCCMKEKQVLAAWPCWERLYWDASALLRVNAAALTHQASGGRLSGVWPQDKIRFALISV